jgi:hypothetical protein
MTCGGTVDQLVDTVFNYPTLSEAYKVAALDAVNKMRAVAQFSCRGTVATERVPGRIDRRVPPPPQCSCGFAERREPAMNVSRVALQGRSARGPAASLSSRSGGPAAAHRPVPRRRTRCPARRVRIGQSGREIPLARSSTAVPAGT